MNPDELHQLQKAFPEVAFPEAMINDFERLWVVKEFKRGDLVTAAGKVERYFYYVVSGVQAGYLIDRKGEKVVLAFTFKGNFSGIYDSFLKTEPSHYFLEALTDSKLLALPRSAYRLLFEQYPDFYKWWKNFIDNMLIGRGKREVEILTLSAEERYINFMRRCPKELMQIPQKYLASYLNMKPETFSRLRASVDY